ncbi:nuclear transport factor 2 family protein [Leucobacter sp. GX24907]
MTVSVDVAREWFESFGRVWKAKDAQAAADIMTNTASYRNTPFLDQPYVGREAIEGFWVAALENVQDVDFRYGRPVVQDDRVAAEWWAIITPVQGEPFTLAGNFLLEFVGEKVSDLRESFVKQLGVHHPHPGWGE